VNDYIRTIITRTNTVNGIKYVDDPTIMAWELANEPRPMAADNFDPFTKWIISTAQLIKKLDPNHLVTTGNEGEKGCSESISLFETINSIPEIDYITIHIWLKNWGWYQHEEPDSTLPGAIELALKYIDDHALVAQKLNKPMVIEEFGLARDHEAFSPGTSVEYRNLYYESVFGQIAASVASGDMLTGCNFWAFSGFAIPIPGQIYWSPGDPYTGDPPQEEQGLNSVFASDTSTIDIIRKYNSIFNRIPELENGNKN